MFGEMFGQPPHRTAYLGNNAFEPSHRGKRVFDNREIDPERQQALSEEGKTLLVVHLPIAAVDKRKRGRLRISGEKQIEPLARSLAVSEVETSGVFAPHPGTACRPIGDDRVALRDRRGVVVGGIELGAVHSAVQHGAGSGRLCNSLGRQWVRADEGNVPYLSVMIRLTEPDPHLLTKSEERHSHQTKSEQ